MDAAAGPAGVNPGDTDVLVVYEDRWTWDITTYLLSLRIDLRDPKTNILLATGHIYRTSLARKSPEAMVRDTVAAILPKG